MLKKTQRRLKTVQLWSIRAAGASQMTSAPANSLKGHSKKSQIHQSTAAVPNENIFASAVQPIQNEILITVSCQHNIYNHKTFSNALPKFRLLRLHTVNYGLYCPYFNHHTQFAKCRSLPTFAAPHKSKGHKSTARHGTSIVPAS